MKKSERKNDVKAETSRIKPIMKRKTSGDIPRKGWHTHVKQLLKMEMINY
ncbi:MAG TPA: hypothetical protein VIJ92_15205 [Ginsengibacter sp.]